MELTRKQEIAFVTGEKGPLQLIKEIVEKKLVGSETDYVLEVEKITVLWKVLKKKEMMKYVERLSKATLHYRTCYSERKIFPRKKSSIFR